MNQTMTATTPTYNAGIIASMNRGDIAARLKKNNERLQKLIEVGKLQDSVNYIEQSTSEELKAKIRPFVEHYGGDVVELLRKRTQQHFDKLVSDDLAGKGGDARKQYENNPDGYYEKSQRETMWNTAYDTTIDEMLALKNNLEQAISQYKSQFGDDEVDYDDDSHSQKRRLFSRRKQ